MGSAATLLTFKQKLFPRLIESTLSGIRRLRGVLHFPLSPRTFISALHPRLFLIIFPIAIVLLCNPAEGGRGRPLKEEKSVKEDRTHLRALGRKRANKMRLKGRLAAGARQQKINISVKVFLNQQCSLSCFLSCSSFGGKLWESHCAPNPCVDTGHCVKMWRVIADKTIKNLNARKLSVDPWSHQRTPCR